MTPGDLVEFAIGVDFTSARAVLNLRGEVDVTSAPELAAILDAVMHLGRTTVVLDVAQVAFIDAAALSVIAGAAGRLQSSGGQLTIRAASPLVRRMLDNTQLSSLINVQSDGAPLKHLGPEQVGARIDADAPPGVLGVPSYLRHVTAIPADNDVVDGALRLVVALARATVGGADGVSVSLRRRGQLSTVAASDQTILDMDASQYATGQGPCVAASNEGRWFHVESLADETRWPDFTPRAEALGIRAILSSPLIAADRPVGALNIYSRTTAAFEKQDQRLAAVFATEASTILADAGIDVTEHEIAARMHTALRTRQVIAQAQGVIMSREGLSEDGAYSALREHSRKTNQPLRERAQDIVASTQDDRPDARDKPLGERHD